MVTARVAPEWQAAGYETPALPSSSPAYTLSLADKLAAWSAIVDHLTDMDSETPAGEALASPARNQDDFSG